MMLIEETAVPLAALPLNAFKDHLRVGSGFSDGDIQDPVLESFLRAAMAAIEARTGKILITRDFSWVLSVWRDMEGQPLPVAPVQTINSLVVRDLEDETLVIDAAAYRLEWDEHRPVLRPKAALLPSVPTGGTVEIGFTAGMGSTWGDMPADLAHACLVLAAHYYEYRHETGLNNSDLPFGVSSLIERYRNVRILGGGTSR